MKSFLTAAYVSNFSRDILPFKQERVSKVESETLVRLSLLDYLFSMRPLCIPSRSELDPFSYTALVFMFVWSTNRSCLVRVCWADQPARLTHGCCRLYCIASEHKGREGRGGRGGERGGGGGSWSNLEQPLETATGGTNGQQ